MCCYHVTFFCELQDLALDISNHRQRLVSRTAGNNHRSLRDHRHELIDPWSPRLLSFQLDYLEEKRSFLRIHSLAEAVACLNFLGDGCTTFLFVHLPTFDWLMPPLYSAHGSSFSILLPLKFGDQLLVSITVYFIETHDGVS